MEGRASSSISCIDVVLDYCVMYLQVGDEVGEPVELNPDVVG